jgi:hypothetical protein
MFTTQMGLKDCFKRASDAIYKSNYTTYLQQFGNNVTPQNMQDADVFAKSAVANAVLSQSYLRLEQPIVANVNTIQFPILVNQGGTPSPTEVRLEQQDAFFTSNWYMYISRKSSTTSVTFPLLTYPNAVDFPAGGLVTANEAPLYTLYNGFLKVTINKSVIIPNYPLSNFLYVPQTQRVASTANAQISQFDPNIVALWEPNINLIGTKSNGIQIQMPSGILTANLDANTTVILIYQGVLAQNVTLMS